LYHAIVVYKQRANHLSVELCACKLLANKTHLRWRHSYQRC